MTRREIPHICNSIRMEEKLESLLHDGDPRLRLYVYRLQGGRRIAPALITGEPFPDLYTHLQIRYGTASYAILIRRGRHMELSGAVSILAPLGWRAPSD